MVKHARYYWLLLARQPFGALPLQGHAATVRLAPLASGLGSPSGWKNLRNQQGRGRGVREFAQETGRGAVCPHPEGAPLSAKWRRPPDFKTCLQRAGGGVRSGRSAC